MNSNTSDRLPVAYGDFFYRKISNALILNSDHFDAAIDVMRLNNIKHLEINSNYFLDGDLTFIHKFDFIESLSINSLYINDISPILSLSKLNTLNIENILPGEIDFTHFKNLRECFFVWGLDGGRTIFESVGLKKLRIDNLIFEKNQICNLLNLKSLSLYHSNIKNISELNCLPDLLKLDVTGCKYLEDIEQIKDLISLEELRIDNCYKIVDIEPITHLTQLVLLSFNNIGNVRSIKEIVALKKLKEIYFSENTNILDGDLGSLEELYKHANLKMAHFKSRRHYTHKPQDLGFKLPDVVSNIFQKK